jgi:hypothetical protein
MNMVEIGSNVTLKVKNPYWDRRSAYSFAIAEFETYMGTVLPSPKWVGPDQLCLSTGDPKFPFRVIDKVRILGEAMERLPEPVQSVWTIAGSKVGQNYIVTRSGSHWSCNCVGFGYRRTCSHVNEAKSLIYNDNSKSLISKEEKKLKKSEKSALLISKSAVESKSELMKRGNSAPIYNEVNMAKVEKHGDKTKIAIEVMEQNVSKTYDEVCELIAKAIGVPVARARVYYRHKVINKLAEGYENMTRPFPWEGKARTPKTKQVSAKKLLKEVGLKAQAKSVEDIAAIKEANLARLREVSAKAKKTVRRDYGDRQARSNDSEGVADFDPQLAKEEIQSILRDERLIDVVPKFIREDA